MPEDETMIDPIMEQQIHDPNVGEGTPDTAPERVLPQPGRLVAIRTRGLSPKVLWDLTVTVVAFLVTAGVVSLDPEVAALISKLLGTAAGVWAGPGKVEFGEEADDLDPFESGEAGVTLVELLVVVLVVAVVVLLFFGPIRNR